MTSYQPSSPEEVGDLFVEIAGFRSKGAPDGLTSGPESHADLVESAVSLAASVDRLRIMNAAWMMGKQTPAMSLEMLDASEQVRLAVVALAGAKS